MRKIGYLAIILALVLVACQPSTDEEPRELPTLVEFPTATDTPPPSFTPTDTPTSIPTNTDEPTRVPTDTDVPTNTPTATDTPRPSATVDATQADMNTATAAFIEAPVFSTFTPLPPGAIAIVVRPTSTGTPEIMADVVITEGQFQEEVDRLIEGKPGISRARVSFIPGGVQYDLTADSDGVFITGTIIVPFEFSGGSINNILTIGGAVEIIIPDTGEEDDDEEEEIPSAFLARVAELVLVTQESFNFILNQRLGEGNHDLENIVIVDDHMLISLVVPLPSN